MRTFILMLAGWLTLGMGARGCGRSPGLKSYRNRLMPENLVNLLGTFLHTFLFLSC